MKTIEDIEKQQIKQLTEKKKIPDFSSGDTIKVHMKVTEGSRERIQIFEGACIAKKNAGINSSFTIRKISFGEGVERVFPYSLRRFKKSLFLQKEMSGELNCIISEKDLEKAQGLPKKIF